ncbi:GNAT family N-acetyltransferase [Mucilaginibacter galii]|uniref:N-acetyltransferase n=1 Tax=Mucilaginibacter galii TaxID=2005073 RepID=A0A917J663_9SPHI|nr:GNAT family N-acetyltransferase [Mucilaginibacter galii]GGI49900.1 N-acetyltransferase [Mucilaginibacter galii]
MYTVIETPRLIIREFTPNEEHLLVAMGRDERITRYVTPRTDEEIKSLFQQILAGYKTLSRFGRWAIIDKACGEFIGTCMLMAAREGLTGTEIGYNLHYNYWGQGLATETVNALVAYGFETGLAEICAITDGENKASQRVLQKTGFTTNETVLMFGKYIPLYIIKKGDH